MLARELDRALEEAVGQDRADGVVRVVQVHEPRAAGDLAADGVQVRREPQLRHERHQDRLGAGQRGPPV